MTSMRGPSPEASGEALGLEGDDSNMDTVPTSGPEATSSQGDHTLGPWFVGAFLDIFADCQEDTENPIASIHERVEVNPEFAEEAKANARLIAAAPDLLAALHLVLDQVDYTAQACAVTEMVGACLSTDVIDRARAAIAKVQP